MRSGEVFIDSVALMALVNQGDALHIRARDLLASINTDRRPAVTSEWVLAEFLGGASRVRFRAAAIGIVGRLLRSPRVTIVQASHDAWMRAFELFRARQDKSWSLADCTSIVICQDRGIREVFTHDHHFRQAGFEILL